MAKDLKNIIQETLNEKYIVKESFSKLVSSNKTNVIDNLFETLDNIVKENHTDSDVDRILKEYYDSSLKMLIEQEEQSGNPVLKFLKSLFDSGIQLTPEEKSKLQSDTGKGAWSQMKEWILRQLLALTGFRGPVAEGLSAFFADVQPRDFIAMFRYQEYCNEVSLNVGKSVIESIAAAVIESSTNGQGSFAYNLIRNQVFSRDYIDNMGKTVGLKMCQAIHSGNLKTGILNRLSGQEQNQQNNPENPVQEPQQ